jgi:hypothetical protein
MVELQSTERKQFVRETRQVIDLSTREIYCESLELK